MAWRFAGEGPDPRRATSPPRIRNRSSNFRCHRRRLFRELRHHFRKRLPSSIRARYDHLVLLLVVESRVGASPSRPLLLAFGVAPAAVLNCACASMSAYRFFASELHHPFASRRLALTRFVCSRSSDRTQILQFHASAASVGTSMSCFQTDAAITLRRWNWRLGHLRLVGRGPPPPRPWPVRPPPRLLRRDGPAQDLTDLPHPLFQTIALDQESTNRPGRARSPPCPTPARVRQSFR